MSKQRPLRVKAVVDLVHRIEKLRAELRIAERRLWLMVKQSNRPRGAPRADYGFTVAQYKEARSRGGSRRKAAAILGVPPQSLDTWCKRNKEK